MLDRERRQPQRRIGLAAARGLDRRHAGESRRLQNAAEQRREQPGVVGLGNRLDAASRHQDFQEFGAHPLGRKRRQPLALGDRRRKAIGVERAVAEPRREAEEAQDAQEILADAFARRRR